MSEGSHFHHRSWQRTTRVLAAALLSFAVISCKHTPAMDTESSLASSSSGSIRYMIKSLGSGLCIDVPESKFKDGVDLRQWTCNGSDAQLFDLVKTKGDYYKIVTNVGKKVIDIDGKSTKAGAKVQIWSDKNGDNQAFKFENKESDSIMIRSKSSNLVLDVESGSSGNGAAILQWQDMNASNQKWVLVKFDTSVKEKTVEITKDNHVYFLGNDNQREKKFSATLPDNIDPYSRAVLHFKLSCPSGSCDAWDRLGSFGVYSSDHDNKYLELLRFMTPYGIGGEWTLDVTDFLPLLKGKQNFRLSIDTWVGPGSSSGNGWLVTLNMQYIPGYSPERTALIIPLLSFADIAYGNPNNSTSRSVNVVPKGDYKTVKAVSIITGHGQGNADNCAEFCQRTHTISVGDKDFSKTIWRDDCATTTSQAQRGNAKDGRAGWCPGDISAPWAVDITSAMDYASDAKYDVQGYENTCRPDSKNCGGCTLGTSCQFDGGLHTDPKYYVTTYIIYKK